ncbi:hypothetical protein [Actinoplanes sp. L3-i22]|uniref:hypothetical protein n=1 Tax=Actinoplanes sp. L3-i22 TaxID=2836373 RepID=UPI001C776708|nr:hypothetical protein [Actinoplanes sp. L3-i22]BCY15573.1 hypothetical protein L3i22_106610 [Actinoplanes sp. L3-i22]
MAPLVAGLGGVAAFASLISEWQVTTVDGLAYGSDEVGETKMLPTDLFDLSGVGAAYLIGLLLLTVAVLLALVGPAAGQRYARLAGLGAGGVLFALLLAMIQMLGAQSRLVSRAYMIAEDAEHLKVALGRGLWCALAAVAAALIALWLSGRGSAKPPVHREVPAELDEDEPLELSIMPTAPFAPTSDNRDIPLR